MINELLSTANGYLGKATDAYREATSYPRPICRLVVDGVDITPAVVERLVSIDLQDNRGLNADQLEVTLSDHDGKLAIPRRGVIVRLWLGWSDTGLVDKGTYTVDETEHSGAPDIVTFRARSVDLRAGLKVKRERSWHGQWLRDIIQTIASSYGLGAVVGGAFKLLKLDHFDQTNESDANMLTRLGLEHDAIATVKAGKLLFMPIGGSTTATGLALPFVTIDRTDGDQHRFLQADRNSYTGVRAFYYQVNSAAKKEAIAGSEEALKDLRHVYSDRRSALNAARAEFRRLQRGSATLSYTLAKGRPELFPELSYVLSGIKEQITEIVWLGGNVKHSFTPEAYTTSLELESKLPEEEDVTDLADSTVKYTGIVAVYRDEKTGKEKKLTLGDQAQPKRLPHLYASHASAKRAVAREFKRLNAAA